MSRRTVRAYNKQKHTSVIDSDPLDFRFADVLSVWDAVSGFIEEYMLLQKVIPHLSMFSASRDYT